MDFKLLGLNKYESAAYESLIRVGKATAAKLASESRVPYSRIYDVLESLIQKGLVKAIPEKTKQFIASDPENLDKFFQEKKKQFEEMEKKLKELKANYGLQEKDPIIVSKGKVNFTRLLREVPEAKTFAYKIKYTAAFNPEWVRRHNELKKKVVSSKTLTRYDEETKKNVQSWLGIDKAIRKFHNNGVAIDIRDESVLISLIPPNNPNAIVVINNRNFADIMRRLFEAAYDKAEQIPKE